MHLRRRLTAACLGLALFYPAVLFAAGWLEPGDVQLRSDLTTVVDAGLADLPITGWPIPRADLCGALPAISADPDPDTAQFAFAALERLRAQCALDLDGSAVQAFLGDVDELRGFSAEPRSNGVLGVASTLTGERRSARLALSLHADPQDGHVLRPDGSFVAAEAGNWTLSAGWLDRWWGPGWDGSLIWSNNARPIPGLSLDRLRSTPFQSRWLRWIGPWRATAFLGMTEHDRVDVDDALFLGLRLSARPIDGLELAFSRTAQFCGDGLPCSWSSFKDLIFGYDNPGADAGLDPEDEPGNQLGSVEARWSSPIGNAPYALYTQLTGEDEANFFPVKLLKLYGADGVVQFDDVPVRLYLEYANTSCASSNPDKVYNCAYNQHLFNVEGYRFRGRAIGHAMDNDGVSWTAGAAWVSRRGWAVEWVGRWVQINRGGAADPRHSLSPTPVDRAELVAAGRKAFAWGTVQARLGVHHDQPATGRSDTGVTGYLGFSRGVGFAADAP